MQQYFEKVNSQWSNNRQKEEIIVEKPESQDEAVQVRVISNFQISALTRRSNFAERASYITYGIVPPPVTFTPQQSRGPGRIIFHIHGGGWVTFSSATHLRYLSKWAKETDSIIFSVDYRLSPEYKYPSALNDVFNVYCWLLEHGETQLGIKLDKIVFAGDSAGGNLASVLTILAIERGLRIPDGILLCYPATYPSKDRFTPSLLKSFTEPILSYGFMKMCVKCYYGDTNEDPHTNYYISPLLCHDSIIKKFPKCRILAGSEDPLLDDSYKMLQKLVKNGVEANLKVFQGFSHGWLQFDMLLGMKQAKKTTSESIKELMTLFN